MNSKIGLAEIEEECNFQSDIDKNKMIKELKHFVLGILIILMQLVWRKRRICLASIDVTHATAAEVAGEESLCVVTTLKN